MSAAGLGPDQARVWCARPETLKDPRLRARCEGLLPPEERRLSRAIPLQEDRREYLLARALRRAALSRCAAVAPRDWRFAREAYGRPGIAWPAQNLRFSVSHTRGLVACLVTGAAAAGVDVEDFRRRGLRTRALAERLFSTAEAAALRGLPPGLRRRRFFEFWTLKEAYSKALGRGLLLAWDGFCFRIGAGREPAIEFSPDPGGEAALWQFSLHRPSAAHVLAVCLRRCDGRPVRVRIDDGEPLLFGRRHGRDLAVA